MLAKMRVGFVAPGAYAQRVSTERANSLGRRRLTVLIDCWSATSARVRPDVINARRFDVLDARHADELRIPSASSAEMYGIPHARSMRLSRAFFPNCNTSASSSNRHGASSTPPVHSVQIDVMSNTDLFLLLMKS